MRLLISFSLYTYFYELLTDCPFLIHPNTATSLESIEFELGTLSTALGSAFEGSSSRTTVIRFAFSLDSLAYYAAITSAVLAAAYAGSTQSRPGGSTPGILNWLSTVCCGLFLPSLDINMGSQRGFMRGA